MKVTFVQSDAEYEEARRVIRAGVSLKKAKLGTWIIPPSLSKQADGGQFVVVDSQGGDVFVESFNTADGALAYALGIDSMPQVVDHHGFLKEHGNFV